MKIKKNIIYSGVFFILVVLFGFLFLKNEKTNDNNFIENQENTEVQKIVLGFKDGNYYPETFIVKAKKPVEIYLDSSVKGCYRSFVIKRLGIAKNLATPQDFVKFTPLESGSYSFGCSMGMGTGTMIVE